ncbi:hypothetical protein EKD04_013960 [Chloroflexales bacterium ZM16-3]|nr:hypothetical protein [Chloroflexales bacterium ZM16-3]
MLERTIYPGTTTEMILPRLSAHNANLPIGEDFPLWLLALASYHDSYVPPFHYESIAMESEADLDAALASADCVVIPTDHSDYDWHAVSRHDRLIV